MIAKNFFSLLLFFFCFGPHLAYAAPDIYVTRGLDFGTVAMMTGVQHIVLDATGSGVPVCVPSGRCSIQGGAPGVIQFHDFGAVTITLSFPAEVPLYSGQNTRQGTIYRMNTYSHSTASVVGPIQEALVGGQLNFSPDVVGLSLWGSAIITIIIN